MRHHLPQVTSFMFQSMVRHDAGVIVWYAGTKNTPVNYIILQLLANITVGKANVYVMPVCILFQVVND